MMISKELYARFEPLIKEHELLVFKICRMYTNSVEDREDLYQEIMIQLWKAFPNYKGEAKFSTWMYQVALW